MGSPSRVGEFFFAQNETTTYERSAFLWMIIEFAPDVLKTLEDDVWPLYDPAKNPIAPDDPGRPPELEAAIRAWSTRCGLEAPWCWRQARETLRSWSHTGPGRGWGTMSSYRFCALPLEDEELRFQFSHPGWPLHEKGWKVFEAEIMGAFKAELSTYRQRLEARAIEIRGIRTPQKRKTTEHLVWLVRFQVLGMSYADIAEEASQQRADAIDIDEKAVEVAVKRMATRIAIPLRPLRPGRPKRELRNPSG